MHRDITTTVLGAGRLFVLRISVGADITQQQQREMVFMSLFFYAESDSL